jgi:predicted ATPase
MIEKISVTNFKNHAHTDIELGRVTALVGPNGAGKTALLLAIQVLNQLTKQLTGRDIWSDDDLAPFLRRGSNEMGITVEGRNPQWKIAVSAKGGGAAASLEFENKAYKPTVVYHDGNSETLWPGGGSPIREFGQVAYFKAIAQSVSLPSYTLDIPPTISTDGSDVASVISYLKNSQEERHKKIEDGLRTIVPMIRQIRVHPVPKIVKEKRTITANGNTITYDEDRKVVAQELLFDTQSGNGLPASMVSEGTLVTLALLTLLHTSDAGLFLLDDVEQGLHPLAQRSLIKTLKAFAETHNKQILLTSHSGYIIDELSAEDVWVMALDKEGISRCKRLSDHHDAERLLQVLTTGELADAVGEDWVLQPSVASGEANG